jgi:uncharacterized hydrophobic protein (TIGR00341 family)
MPEAEEPRFTDLLDGVKDGSLVACWQEERTNGTIVLKALFRTEGTPKFLSRVEEAFSDRPDFRYVLIPAVATFPRPERKEDEEKEAEEETRGTGSRLHREELYASISGMTEGAVPFTALTFLSTIVAAVGLIDDSPAVVVGAMMIAPLLGPNIGLSFAITLADLKLGAASLRMNVLGLAVALAVSLVGGLTLSIDPTVREIAQRTGVGLGDIGLALASGAAGALSLTRGLPSLLVGVMVAVALLPPLVTLGLTLGAGLFVEARGAFLLVLTNIICVNLAGVAVFLVQGVRPLSWWEADRAKRATWTALAIWVALLAVLVWAVAASRRL